MTKKAKKDAAARARVGRGTVREASYSSAAFDPVDLFDESHSNRASPIVGVESDSDCGYMGGINCEDFDEEYDSDSSSDPWSDSTADEYEGEALEENLQGIREELADLGPQSQYAQIMVQKSTKNWRKAEKSRALGYTGNSQRTQQRKDKAAREQAAFRKDAQTSYVCIFQCPMVHLIIINKNEPTDLADAKHVYCKGAANQYKLTVTRGS
jgi:hypothetical protein